MAISSQTKGYAAELCVFLEHKLEKMQSESEAWADEAHVALEKLQRAFDLHKPVCQLHKEEADETCFSCTVDVEAAQAMGTLARIIGKMRAI